jgi:A/G-specific adenine glycosylase
VENEKNIPATALYFNEVLDNQLDIANGDVLIKSDSLVYRQQLTHQLIEARFFLTELKSIPKVFVKALWVKQADLKKYAFPKIMNQYLQEIGLKKP